MTYSLQENFFNRTSPEFIVTSLFGCTQYVYFYMHTYTYYVQNLTLHCTFPLLIFNSHYNTYSNNKMASSRNASVSTILIFFHYIIRYSTSRQFSYLIYIHTYMYIYAHVKRIMQIFTQFT